MEEKAIVARLIVKVQEKVLDHIDLKAGEKYTIGRGNDVHYQIKSGALSRQHCEIADCGDHLEVKDLDSLNGTFVNHQRIQTGTLKGGDEVQVGPVVFQVEIKNPASLDKKPEPSLSSDKTTPVPLVSTVTKRPILESEFPSGPCLECHKVMTAKDLSSHAGVFRENKIYCLSCFCNGAREFPILCGYKIIKKLGSGGMGDVYEAIQLSMERPVAFKIMKGLENAADAQVKRFFREAKMGGKLNHPNIVSFIDSGKIEGACFLAMEYVYGWDLKHILEEKGPMSYLEAMRLAFSVATALDFASTRFSIVHRDIKPENILLDRDNVVKLTDFGLAKNFAEAGLSGITKSQTGVGTLYYMPPEQIVDAKFADPRADIYSLGVTLYEIMTGFLPFNGTQMMELVHKIRSDTPLPLTHFVPTIPSSVNDIVMKAMEKNPMRRYQNAKEMMADLEKFC